MKHWLLIFVMLLIFSCKNAEDDYQKPESALDAGREFIQLSLKGKFKIANQYMLQDEDNQYLLARVSNQFNQKSEQEKASFAKASINIFEVTDEVPDSVTVIRFSNSYSKTPQTIKVIKQNGEWKVDFKYTASGNF
jgi:hypothetical protein